MDTIIIILLPLVISGLGFLTYKHPPIARKILRPLLYIIGGSFLLLQYIGMTQSNTYYKAIDATRVNIYKQIDPKLNIDSLFKSVKNKDSINFIILSNRYQTEQSFEVDKYQIALKDSIQKNINLLIENSREANNTYLLYCFASFLAIVILIGLSFLFGSIYNKEKISGQSETK